MNKRIVLTALFYVFSAVLPFLIQAMNDEIAKSLFSPVTKWEIVTFLGVFNVALVALKSFFSTTAHEHRREDKNQMKLPLAVLALSALPLFLFGCARFKTVQKDVSFYENGNPQRVITTEATASTQAASKQALAQWKASQTDKTQGATVGGLNQESDGANSIKELRLLLEDLHP